LTLFLTVQKSKTKSEIIHRTGRAFAIAYTYIKAKKTRARV